MPFTKLKFLPFLLVVILFASCTQSSKKTEEQYLADAKARYEEKKYDEAITNYREFLKNYPKSGQAVYAYNQIAGIQIENLKDHLGAINTYKELAASSPDSKEAKQSLFMVAFIYDETLKDKENAKQAYKVFLQKYPTDTDPNDKMSESARTMLEVLESGKSIEDMIQEKINKMGDSTMSPVDLDIKDDPSGTPQSGTNKSTPNTSDPVKKDSKVPPTNKTSEENKNAMTTPQGEIPGGDPAKK
ncbi:MAG: tetratricopeptide repeat protein [Ignavibacteria bacterium]|nr:tetratricopeptide repeat protein [Ignavibacteria bacterium]